MIPASSRPGSCFLVVVGCRVAGGGWGTTAVVRSASTETLTESAGLESVCVFGVLALELEFAVV